MQHTNVLFTKTIKLLISTPHDSITTGLIFTKLHTGKLFPPYRCLKIGSDICSQFSPRFSSLHHFKNNFERTKDDLLVDQFLLNLVHK